MKGLQKSLAEVADSMGASEDFKAVLLETLYPYLETHEFGENGGPILVIEPLVHMPKEKIDEMMDALDRHAENIGGAGICYKFTSHKALQDTKDVLCNSDYSGNIQWLYYMTEQSKQFLELQGKPVPEHVKKVHDPYVHTRVITAYDRANDHLVHKECEFFVC